MNSHRATPNASPRIVILLSGGIDSSALIPIVTKASTTVSALHVDYGQPARHSEWSAASNIASFFRISIRKVIVRPAPPNHKGEYWGRNAALSLHASALHPNLPLVIALGIHLDSAFYDTTQSFVADFQRLLDGYSRGLHILHAPLLRMTKPEIVSLSRNEGVPLESTYSCESKEAPGCGTCLSCKDRIALGVA